jgi:Protein of unknown function (DUF1488)
MKLERGEVVGYDAKRMTFRFSMKMDDQIVACAISSAALDVLNRHRRIERSAAFQRHRDQIEQRAAKKFQTEGADGMLRLFAKDFTTEAAGVFDEG